MELTRSIRRAPLFLLLACSLALHAQLLKYIDVSAVPPPTADPEWQATLHQPWRTMPPIDAWPEKGDPHALGISLDRVTPTDITLEPFQVEFRVVNTGRAPIDVPVSPHVSEIQPPDQTKPFAYLSLYVMADLRDMESGQPRGFALFELFGSQDRGTVLTLQPGQWIRVKANVKLHNWPQLPIAGRLSGSCWFRRTVFTPGEGGGSTQLTKLHTHVTPFPSVAVRFSPVPAKP